MTNFLFNPKIQDIEIELAQPMQVSELFGMFQTISAVPTVAPKRLINQIQYYKSGATLRLYVYDTVNNVWSYATLT